jgi:hypothetical protein
MNGVANKEACVQNRSPCGRRCTSTTTSTCRLSTATCPSSRNTTQTEVQHIIRSRRPSGRPVPHARPLTCILQASSSTSFRTATRTAPGHPGSRSAAARTATSVVCLPPGSLLMDGAHSIQTRPSILCRGHGGLRGKQHERPLPRFVARVLAALPRRRPGVPIVMPASGLACMLREPTPC